MHLLKNIGKLGAFGVVQGGIPRENADGVALFDPQGNSGWLCSVSQAFRNGELWGVNINVLQQGNRNNTLWVLPQAIEAVYQFALRDYVTFMRDVSNVKPPYTVEAGLVGVKNWDLYVTNQRGGEIFGPMYDDVKLRQTLLNDSEIEQEKFLLRFFEKIFDQSGRERPPHYNGFPRDPMRLIAG
jgi:hypothetical protein